MTKQRTIHSGLFREARQCYSLEDFNRILGLGSIGHAERVVSSLKSSGIAKPVNRKIFDINRLAEESDLVSEGVFADLDTAYIINYVGVIYTDDCVLKCYPKYVDYNPEDPDSCAKIENELKAALKAVRKYKSEIQSVKLLNEGDSSSFNMLGLAVHILHDYVINGLYTNYKEIIETNGDGEIDWDRTIDETFAWLKNNRPHYLELKTVSTRCDELDYFRLLHECIVSECSRFIAALELTDLIDAPQLFLSDSKISDFGSIDYVKYRLEQEIASQFITKKQNLLKTLYAYVLESMTERRGHAFNLYGTNSFNLVWEHACGYIFDNIYDEVKKHIHKPIWKFDDGLVYETDTLIPDIVTTCSLGNHDVFCILDGKYYVVEKKQDSLKGVPGVQDVIKQFAYHKFFIPYIDSLKKSKETSVLNAFLFPESSVNRDNWNKKISCLGSVTVMDWGINELVPVYLLFLDTSFVWKSYLKEVICKDELIEVIKKIRYIENDGIR